MFPIVVDVHEPEEIRLYLKRSLTVIKQANEPLGFADYYWNNGHIIQQERCGGGELIGKISSGKLDQQILKYRDARPDSEIGIIQEGMVTPTIDNKCQTWKKTKRRGKSGQFIYVPDRIIKFQYSAYRAYLYQRELEGIPTIVTMDKEDTALTLSSIVYNSMKVFHQGLRRHVNITVDKKRPYVNVLLSIKGIGQKTATELGTDYKPWDLFGLPFNMLVELIGESKARLIFKGIGKDIE